jgi:hypothetical protein
MLASAGTEQLATLSEEQLIGCTPLKSKQVWS